MGRSFAQIVAHHPLATLAGVADIDLNAAEGLASGLGARSYASAEAMIEEAMLDGIIIATVEHAHLAPCVAALERGIAVLVEKPLATTLADAQAIVNTAQRFHALLTVGHVLRFDARYVTVHQQIQSGAIGDPLVAYARRLNGAAAQKRLDGRVSLPMFLGVHDYDVVRWMVGSEPVQVVAQERRGFLSGQGWNVEDAITALITFENGALATVELNWVLPDGHPTGFDQRLDVTGSSGRAELVGHYAGVTMIDGAGSSWPDTALWPTIHGRVIGALEKETHHFIDCIRDQQDPLVSANDGLVAVKIALAAEESARNNEIVFL
jgi:predicted dehydrogenase